MAIAIAGNSGDNQLGRWLRVALIGAIGVVAIILLTVAAVAVVVVGATVTAAALIARQLRRPRPRQDGPPLIEARRLPDGWTAEPN